MASHDLFHNVVTLPALNFQTISTNTTTVGAIIDTAAFYSLTFAIQSGTITDGAYAIKIEEGDAADLSDAVVVPADFILGSLAGAGFVAANDNAVHKVGYVGKKRYARLSVVSTSVTTGGAFGAIAILSDPRHAPAA